ncbi:MAG: hypothetical protein RL272_1080 [Candidatus Parcubacteria bacterium]|jgi:hypothetical protein
MEFLPPSSLHVAGSGAAARNRSSRTSLSTALVAAFGMLVATGVFVAFRPAYASIGDIFALGIAWIFNIFTGWAGQLLLKIIEALVVVAQYNGFVTSAPVVNGWSIVRDITNMFFILVLLVIAFGTILGVDAYSYKNKMLSRLLIMAVVVNFSRTICGLLIDFAQVVMLTFVYGFKEAAGGNFADAFRITSVMQPQETIASSGSTSGDSITAWSIAVAMILAFVMVLIACVVCILMLITLVIRIVYLWLLIVMSPLAFFLKAVPGGAASGYYGMWWKMFTGQVIVGPVMAFFLWLALVSVASGQLTSQFGSSADNESVNGTISQAFASTEIQSFVIGICLMMGGLQLSKQISSESAGAAPGIAKKAAGLAMRGGKALGRGAGAVGRGAANATGVTAGYNAAKDRLLSAGTRIPLVSSAAGKALGEHRQKMQTAGADSAKWMQHLSTDERKRLAKSTLPDAMLSPEARGAKKEALRLDVKDMAEKGAKTDAEKKEFFQKRAALESLGSRIGDKSVASDVKGLYKKRPDLIVDKDEKDPAKLRAQREALKRTAGSLSAKDIEDMNGAHITPAVLAQMNPGALLGSRDALRSKLDDMSPETRGKVAGMLKNLDDAEVAAESSGLKDKALGKHMRELAGQEQGAFLADSVSQLDDASRASYFSGLGKDQLGKMPAEALSSALVAAAGSAGGLTGDDSTRLAAAMERMASALASQPQAIERLPQQLRQELKESLSSSGADAPLAMLAAGGTPEEAFKGYDAAKMQQFMSTGDNAANVARLVNPNRMLDNGGANPMTANMLMKLDVDSVAGMAAGGKDGNAFAAVQAAEAAAAADPAKYAQMAGISESQAKELQQKAKDLISGLEATGNLGAAGSMTFTGRAMAGMSEKMDKVLSAPERAAEAIAAKASEKWSAMGRKLKEGQERAIDAARTGRRIIKRL